MSVVPKHIAVETEDGLTDLYYAYTDTADVAITPLQLDPYTIPELAPDIDREEMERLEPFLVLDQTHVALARDAFVNLSEGREISQKQKELLYAIDTFAETACELRQNYYGELEAEELVAKIADPEARAVIDEEEDTVLDYLEDVLYAVYAKDAIVPPGSAYSISDEPTPTEAWQNELAADVLHIKISLAIGALYAQAVENQDPQAALVADALAKLVADKTGQESE